jgi:LPXTG-motif cell wall-anchored protein
MPLTGTESRLAPAVALALLGLAIGTVTVRARRKATPHR